MQKNEKRHRSRITRNGQVTLPKSIRNELALEEGDLIRFVMDGERVLVIPEMAVARDEISTRATA